MAFMTHRAILNGIVRRICKVGRPQKVVLFGSRARGTGRPDSDYDILVIQRSDQPRYRRSGPFYAALADLPAEVEVIVYTPEEVQDWRQVPQAFISTAIREGQVLYEDQG
jgi:predicted nucleotidyltransferase